MSIYTKNMANFGQLKQFLMAHFTKKHSPATNPETWVKDHVIMIIFLFSLDLIISLVVRQFGAFVINKNIFFFPAELWVMILIVIVTTWLCFYYRLSHSYPISCVLIVAGIWSNLTERVIFDGVADFLDIYIAKANLADFEIWFGLLVLNLQVWFPAAANKIHLYLQNFKKIEQV